MRRRFTGELSVIIPCHGRHRLIADLLRLLEIQTLSRDRREILLVDDGSRPPLASRLPAALRKNVRILRLRSRRGPAAARNLALEKAGGRIVLFLNSDAVPSPDLLEAHLAAQNGGRENAAVLGRFDSHPSCADLFLRLCDLGELIFPYQRLRPGIVQPGNFFWTCNLSIRRSAVLRAGGFDPEFPYPMQDDIELGFRLWKLGTGVIYHPEIECSHRHPMNYWQLIERYRLMGQEWVRFARKHGPAASFELLGRPFEADHNLGRDILAHLDRLEKEMPDATAMFDEQYRVLQQSMAGTDPESSWRQQAPRLARLLEQILRKEWLRGAVAAIAGVNGLRAAGMDPVPNRNIPRGMPEQMRRRIIARAPCWNARTEQLWNRIGWPLEDCILQNRSELEAFCEWIERHKIRSFLEIGAWTGRLGSLLSRLFAFRKTAVCDQLLAYRVGLPVRFSSSVEVFVGSSHSPEFLHWRGQLGHIDLTFIDGDHSYEGVKKDFELQRQFPHRFIAFHDITGGRPATQGVATFWRELREGPRLEICLPNHSIGEKTSRMGIGIWSRNSRQS